MFKNPSLISENRWKLSRKNKTKQKKVIDSYVVGKSLKVVAVLKQSPIRTSYPMVNQEVGEEDFTVCKQKRRMFLLC